MDWKDKLNFFNSLENEHNINLNIEQQKAVSHINGPALILAGPGSGKTTVITARAAYLVKEAGVKPQSILTLTYNKAAQLEMDMRFTRLYGNEIQERMHFSTLHSFCNRVVRDYERKKGQRLKRIEGEDMSFSKPQLLKDIYLSINNSKINDDELENLVNEIGLVKNGLIKNFEGMKFSTKRFIEVFKAYDDFKKKNLLIDFDDMLTYAYNILTRDTQLLEYYRSRYRYIQVDEGQDLSKIQFEIIKLLTAESRNLFVVADDDQSIYGFRGAQPQYILDFEKQYSGCMIFRLEKNYRSAENLVALSSNFIKNNKKRYNKQHCTDNQKHIDPAIIAAFDRKEQLEVIINRLKTLSEATFPQTKKQGVKIQTAVLYRNNLSSILIADKLDRCDMPFRIKQNRLYFFNHWLVQEVTAFLLFALDPQDVESFSKIYYRMNRYISKAMLEYAVTENGSKPVIDCIMNGVELKPFQINGLQELKLEFSGLAKKRPWNALEYIKNNFHYLDSIKENCRLTGIAYEHPLRLFEILEGIALNCQTIIEFLGRLSELEKLFEGSSFKRDMNSDKDIEITLSTIHSSKGLEYDYVFMIDLINSEFPGDKALQMALESHDYTDIEEERRLFYVGMTRARYELFLIYPSVSNSEKLLPSMFIKEVDLLLKKEAVSEFGDGVVVHHKKFGRGVVISMGCEDQNDYQHQIIEIKFFNGEVKKLDLQICMENKMLEIEHLNSSIDR